MRGDMERALNRGGRPPKPPGEVLSALTVRIPAYQIDELCGRALRSEISVGKVLTAILMSVLGPPR